MASASPGPSAQASGRCLCLHHLFSVTCLQLNCGGCYISPCKHPLFLPADLQSQRRRECAREEILTSSYDRNVIPPLLRAWREVAKIIITIYQNIEWGNQGLKWDCHNALPTTAVADGKDTRPRWHHAREGKGDLFFFFGSLWGNPASCLLERCKQKLNAYFRYKLRSPVPKGVQYSLLNSPSCSFGLSSHLLRVNTLFFCHLQVCRLCRSDFVWPRER